MPQHLFVDISSHGFGHLAQVAPILNALFAKQANVRLTIRSGLAQERLRARIVAPFEHIAERSDFGFVMLDAVRIDIATTAAAYRTQHANWPQRVADEARFLSRLQPDLVLTDVAYLPLAGAEQVGIPAFSMCSLNWADLFAHFFGKEAWAEPIHAEILAAYRSAECFLRLTPAMPMNDFPRVHTVAPVAALGQNRRAELHARLGSEPSDKICLMGFGGFDKDVPIDRWPHTPGLRWLIPQSWPVVRDDMTALESLGFSFTDLLCSVDAVITKPGYGTFTEAACNGIPVLYVKRDDWPEQDFLIDWLKAHARCLEIGEAELLAGLWSPALEKLSRQSVTAMPEACGAREAAEFIAARLITR